MEPPSTAASGVRSERAAVGVLCLLFGLSLGAHYGVADQNLYLLQGIRMGDPGFLSRDWYLTQTAQHYVAFTYLVWAMQAIGPIPWVTGVLFVLLKAGVALSAYLIFRALYREPLPPFLAAMILLHLAVGNPKLLSHPFLVPWLIPAGMSTAFTIAGLAALAHGGPDHLARNALAGSLLGLGALLHGTFLFLLPPFLAGLWVALPGRVSRREWLAFSIPFLLLTVPIGWSVVTRFDFGEAGLHRLDSLLRLRVPHHHLPRTWGWTGFALFAKHVALGAIGLGLAWPETRGSRVVLAATASLAGLFAFVFLCTVVIFVPQVATLQAFHFISLLSFLSILFFAGAVAREVREPVQGRSTARLCRLAALAVGTAIAFQVSAPIGGVLAGLVCICLVGAQRVGLRTASPIFARRVLLVGACVFLSGLGAFCLPLSTAFFDPYGHDSGIARWVRERTPPRILWSLIPPVDEHSLFEWVEANTPKDAVFVVPFEMERFRLAARRAIVVDWKGFPYRARDAEEWYHRVTRVCGVADPVSKQDILEGYLLLDAGRARQLREELGAGYLVVAVGRHRGDLTGLPRVFANEGFAVYRLDEGR